VPMEALLSFLRLSVVVCGRRGSDLP
jgi:hypothetical protein